MLNRTSLIQKTLVASLFSFLALSVLFLASPETFAQSEGEEGAATSEAEDKDFRRDIDYQALDAENQRLLQIEKELLAQLEERPPVPEHLKASDGEDVVKPKAQPQLVSDKRQGTVPSGDEEEEGATALAEAVASEDKEAVRVVRAAESSPGRSGGASSQRASHSWSRGGAIAEAPACYPGACIDERYVEVAREVGELRNEVREATGVTYQLRQMVSDLRYDVSSLSNSIDTRLAALQSGAEPLHLRDRQRLEDLALDTGRAGRVGPAKVIASYAILRAGPGEENLRLMTLHRGARLEVESSRGRWAQVRTNSGVRAWLPHELITVEGFDYLR